MLKAKKKITKRDLKQDGLLTAYADATTFYYANKKYLNYVLTGLVALVVVVAIYVNNRRANNEKASAELGKVFPIVDAAAGDSRQYAAAIDGQPERGVMGLKAIVDNYGGTESGDIARFYLANAYFNLGRIDEALEAFEDFGGGDKLLRASAEAGIGACMEARKEYAKAASSYERAATLASNPLNSPPYLNSAARCHMLAGDKEKAAALYRRLKKEYPSSPFAREADRYIAQLAA